MFNKDSFSNILKNINNEYVSMTEFAKQATLDRSYISKYLNKKLNNPPTPKILSGIANASKGITTYDELMQVCGYLNTKISSREIIAQNICNDFENEIDSLNILDIDKNYIFDILIKQNEKENTVINKLNSYIEFNFGINDKSKQLFNILQTIDQKIKDIVIIPNNVGIPLYSISSSKMLKVGYFPFEYTNENYFAVKATNDKMLPLLGIDDVAVIYPKTNLVDGETLLLLIDDSYYEIAKINAEGNMCKLYFMNSKFEELELSRIKIIGEVTLCQNQSAFKKRKGN